jgi:hypothetical protein
MSTRIAPDPDESRAVDAMEQLTSFETQARLLRASAILNLLLVSALAGFAWGFLSSSSPCAGAPAAPASFQR